MAEEIMVGLSLAVNLVIVVLLLTHAWSKALREQMGQHAATLEKGQERVEKSLREEMARGREEFNRSSMQTREEMATALTSYSQTLQTMLLGQAQEQKSRWEQIRQDMLESLRDLASAQKDRFEGFVKETGQLLEVHDKRAAAAFEESHRLAKVSRDEMATASAALNTTLLEQLRERTEQQQAGLDAMRQGVHTSLAQMAESQHKRFEAFNTETSRALDSHDRHTVSAISEMASQHKGLLDSFSRQLTDLTQMNSQKLEQIRDTVEARLTALQEDNSAKLEQMRATVDEKLHQTLEQRLGESFKLVSERLEQVHKGLGEMQTLASGVGDLKKVLTNVKTRGTLGEIQLENILEQTLSPEQFERNHAVMPGSAERVDFAVLLPGPEQDAPPVLLPIDCKFPIEDYQRLLDAEEAGDPGTAADAAKMLESRVKAEAKSIQEKYLNPPRTTDFAIMFLPIEGLYAEVLRRPGLWDTLQREYHVVVTGPTTITALLNSLQMGFRTLAIQKRSSEVWSLLGAVKSEFGKFGDVLEKTQKKLQEASNTIDSAARRSRAIERKLRTVEALPSAAATAMLPEVEAVVSD